ncbi:hypothetical protein [Rhizobium rhizophilum]|uniref:DUF2946 domain-containing protein n=1 Tax=Rhizobium rhizophilum TaxID=1850373 RepID=A0ABY2QZL4_9HYPH|nr:hypothetical protein [Rhizobium rhizophilum]THV16878.1 hypothetical protein E9677_02445 [Rhizobium rhizophilum]
MEDRSLRYDAPPRQRVYFKAVIASLFASLLLLFGGDAFGRFHPGLSTAGAMSRSDNGQTLAVGHGDSRFLTASEQSSRPKLRPGGSGDGCLNPDIPTLWMCRHGDLLRRDLAANIFPASPQPYWSRAPPQIQHTA